jgi:hypothetical protein
LAKRAFRRILGVRKGALRQSANVSGNPKRQKPKQD